MPVNAPVIANPDVATEAVKNVGRTVDMNIFGLFFHADPLVKLIILILVTGAFVSWMIIVQKSRTISKLNAQANKFEDAFWSGESLDKLYDRVHAKPSDPMTAVFCIGMKEWRRGIKNRFRSQDREVRTNLVGRVDRVMDVTISRELSAAERYMTFLASTGSTAPFIGLLGTVWGIMHAFVSIAGSNNTALSVVAPGIAEALYTTALSLIAAIPAVLAYNKFNNDLGKYGDRLEGFASEFSSILGRYLEESGDTPQQQHAA